MSSNQHINEQDLDGLLRELALEENSAIPNEAEADLVFSLEYDVKIDQQKERDLLKRLNKKGGSGRWLIIPGLLFIISCLFWLLWYPDDDKTSIIKNGNTEENRFVEGNEKKELQNEQIKPVIKIKDTFGKPKVIDRGIYDTIKIKEETEVKNKNVIPERTVPFIVEADIIKYRKIKEQMITRLVKHDKGLYTHVPSDKTSYMGKEIVLNGFILRNVGITNLEYKIFLADLLSQKRKEDYLTAEVKNNWILYGYPLFAASYFENDKYNDFPVVNVTYDGATLFCKWLQEEIENYCRQHNLKNKFIIRLPYDEEWIYAAREGYAKIAFEPGYNTIYDESEGLVDRAFTKRAELVKKRVKRVDTMYTQFTTNHYGWSEKEINDFFESGFKYYSSATPDTIYPDRMKIYGKIGRVSEITGQRNGSKLYLTGLSWKAKADYLKMENEFKSNLSSPFVGFRIVVIDPDEPEYKNPFW